MALVARLLLRRLLRMEARIVRLQQLLLRLLLGNEEVLLSIGMLMVIRLYFNECAWMKTA